MEIGDGEASTTTTHVLQNCLFITLFTIILLTANFYDNKRT